MKKQVTTKRLLEALLQTYMDTNDLKNIYNGDGSELMTVDEAVKFVNGLKEEASPEQVAFESSLDNMMEEFRTYFPNLRTFEAHTINVEEGTSFDLMHSIWNHNVQPELMTKYSNL